MVRFICAALLLGSLSHGQELSGTEKALLEEQRLWMIVNENSPGVVNFFSEEGKRLIDERAALQLEKSAFAQEKQDLTTERQNFAKEKAGLELSKQQVSSDRKQIEEDSKSIDAREQRVARVEAIMKAAPWVAVGVFAAGVVVGILSSQ
jgi:ElaB/YqjD/DUF883 family membrane-anchored ribosome-binding protein